MDAEAIKQQAQDENTPTAILAKLSKSKDKEILRLVAGNPNTSVKVLEQLGARFPDEVTANPIFDLLLLENSETRFILLSLARASTTSIEKLAELANHKNILVQQAVVRNAKTPGNVIDTVYRNKKIGWSNKAFLENKNTKDSILKEIAIRAGENTKYVYDLILKHPNASRDTIEIVKLCNGYPDASPHALHKLSGYKNSKILSLVAIHPNTSLETLKNINSKAGREVREHIAKHPNTPEDVLHSLANDYYYDVRILIAKRENILEKTAMILAQDLSWGDRPGWRIRKEIAGNPGVSKGIISSLIKDEHHQIRAAIAQREDISEEQAMILIHDTSDYVRKKLADNPHVSPAIAKLLDTPKEHRYRERLEAWKKSNVALKKLDKLLVPNNKKKSIDRRYISSYVLTRLTFSVSIIPQESIKQIQEFIRDIETFYLFGFISNPDTPAEILNQLANNESYLIRKGVAEHPRTKLATLNKLKTDNNTFVREKVAQSLKISSEIIEELVQDSVPLIRRAIAENPQTPNNILNQLTRDPSLSVRYAIAGRADISEEQAIILARDPSYNVKKKLADNPHISPAVTKLLNIANRFDTINDNWVREHLEAKEQSRAAINEFKRLLEFIHNPDTPAEILNQLATNDSYVIRQGVAEHPKTKLTTFNKLKTDNNINVRKKVAANPNISLKMIEELSQDSMAIVRQAIVNNPRTTMTVLNKLTSDRSDCVRGAITLRKDISESIAMILANDSSAYVRQRLVGNPNISAKILELLSKDIDLISKEGNRSVQIEIIKNVDLSPKLFKNLASSSSAKVRKEVAKHPKAPMSVLDRLKTDEDKYVRVEVAKHPNISSEIMEYLAKDSINAKSTSYSLNRYSNRAWQCEMFRVGTDYHHQVRLAIAQRKDITKKAASILSKDPLPQVRQTLAKNINILLNILISLCEDSDLKVQDEAIKMFLAR